jgi:hypothetical protein
LAAAEREGEALMNGQYHDGSNSARETPNERADRGPKRCEFCRRDEYTVELTWIGEATGFWICDLCDTEEVL